MFFSCIYKTDESQISRVYTRKKNSEGIPQAIKINGHTASGYNRLSVETKYWDGANSYLRLKWTENGFTPEFLDISELELVAERYKTLSSCELMNRGEA